MCEVTPTPPLNITMVKIKNGSWQRGHVRCPNKKDTLKIKWGNRENLMGTTPQGTTYVKRRTTFARKLFPSLQDDFAENETSSQWRSWWICLLSILLREKIVGWWSPHVLSTRCSAYGSWCTSSTASELDLCRTSEFSGCNTRWWSTDETEFPTQWENVVAT